MEYDELDQRLRLAFIDGARFHRELSFLTPAAGLTPQFRRFEFIGTSVDIGLLGLPTGHVVAADIFTMLARREPFIRVVPPGEYPITLTIATDRDSSRRLAFARITFRPTDVAWWDIATSLDTRNRQLPVDNYEGYGVDSGIGAFLDASTARFLLMNSQYTEYPACLSAMNQNQATLGLAQFLSLPAPFERTIAIFASGLGSGVFDSYWGMGKDDKPVCLLTDFNLAGEPTLWGREPQTIWRRIRHWWLTHGTFRR